MDWKLQTTLWTNQHYGEAKTKVFPSTLLSQTPLSLGYGLGHGNPNVDFYRWALETSLGQE